VLAASTKISPDWGERRLHQRKLPQSRNGNWTCVITLTGRSDCRSNKRRYSESQRHITAVFISKRLGVQQVHPRLAGLGKDAVPRWAAGSVTLVLGTATATATVASTMRAGGNVQQPGNPPSAFEMHASRCHWSGSSRHAKSRRKTSRLAHAVITGFHYGCRGFGRVSLTPTADTSCESSQIPRGQAHQQAQFAGICWLG
jgi:hypothetical protein